MNSVEGESVRLTQEDCQQYAQECGAVPFYGSKGDRFKNLVNVPCFPTKVATEADRPVHRVDAFTCKGSPITMSLKKRSTSVGTRFRENKVCENAAGHLLIVKDLLEAQRSVKHSKSISIIL